jgi:hypothetical protein
MWVNFELLTDRFPLLSKRFVFVLNEMLIDSFRQLLLNIMVFYLNFHPWSYELHQSTNRVSISMLIGIEFVFNAVYNFH